MGLVISDADRDVGVVYLDADRRDVASTHALVIGVGRYASDRLSPVGSPPLSARMMGQWFLDGLDETKPGGFANAEKPLGSLSVLLSELADGACSRFADISVPRATFDNVKKAVEAWIERAGSNPDNFLFLFISSHGESFGRRTAFLLEDYGTRKTDITAGMSEIEQFVEALANVAARQQLLIFDCCRTPTQLGLRLDQEFGTRLVNLPAATDGRIRRAHVLRSTGLGFEAWGRKDGPTVFSEILLDALRGLAASSSDDWTIDNFGLARTVARLLDLHERNGEPLQMPDSQLNAPFVVSAVPPTDMATVFVSLGREYDFSKCTVCLDDRPVGRPPAGTARTAPFIRLDLPKYQVRKIAALDAGNRLIGEMRIEPVPPVAFRELPEPFKVTRAPARKGLAASSGKGQIALSLETAAASPLPGVTAVIRRSGTQTAAPVTVSLSADGEGDIVSVEPGQYDVSVDTSYGRTLFSTVNVKADVTTKVTLRLRWEDVRPNAPAQDIEARTAENAIRPRYSTEKTRTVRIPEPMRETDPGNWVRQLGASEERTLVGGWPGAEVFAAPISSASSQLLAGLGVPPSGGSIVPELVSLVPRSPGVFTVEDRMARRLPQRLDQGPARLEQADQPVWVAAAGEDWREIAAVPSIGVQGKFQNDAAGKRDSWMPTVVLDPTPRATGSRIHAVVDTRQWGGLLSFLARRDFELSAVALEDLVGTDNRNQDIRIALFLKVENPLAAVAGALVAVATGRLAQLKIPEQWLRNLTNWFPQLPDGPVILARHLMLRRESERAEVKALLREACRRGVPLFSLSVDWLAQGLADFADDPQAAAPASSTRLLAQLCDPTRVFTVLRIPIDKDQPS